MFEVITVYKHTNANYYHLIINVRRVTLDFC
jgi:hypothetical protein